LTCCDVSFLIAVGDRARRNDCGNLFGTSTKLKWRCSDFFFGAFLGALLCVFFGVVFSEVFDPVLDPDFEPALVEVSRERCVDPERERDVDSVRERCVDAFRDDDRCWRVRREGCIVVAVTVRHPPVTSNDQMCQVGIPLASPDPCPLFRESQQPLQR